MPFLRQSTAQVIRFGPCVDVSDGATEETALTLAQADMRLSKDGGAFAQKSAAGNATHDSDGWYSTTLSTTDTNTVGELILNVHQPANMFPIWMRWWVLEEAIYDDLFGASATGYLEPTTAGRTLDVTATGEAGIDLDNTTGTIAAAQIATAAITSAKFAAGAIDAAAIATDAITAAKIAADAIGSSELATTAVDDIADGVWDEVLTGGTHNVVNSAGRRLRFLQEAGSYDGAIWIDTVNGTAGTTDFENGTDTNPVDTIADANTLAASLGISRFMVAPGSSITFAAAQTDQFFTGHDWTLNLGSQNLSGSFIEGATIAASTMTAAAGGTVFYQCIFDSAVTLAPCVIRESYIGNITMTAGSAGNFFINFCMSRVAGTATPTFDFGSALNASNLSVRHYSGGMEIQNMGAGTGTYNMSLEGRGNLIINANCSATSNIAIRGPFTLTNNASGMTITQDARIDMPQINAQCDTALTDYDAVIPADLGMPQTNTAFSNIEFLMVDSTDHVTPETGLTVSGTRSIDGGAFAAVAGTIAEVGNGIYQIDATAADMNGDVITFRFTGTGADDTFLTIKTRP